MKFGDVLTYRQTEGTASWTDKEGKNDRLSVWEITSPIKMTVQY